MQDPRSLYELIGDVADVPAGLHLIAGLTGFTDAGSAVSQVTELLAGDDDARDVAVFDNDALLDYRARRPIMYFDEDHLSEYRPARLALSLAHDELHRPFLLLTGYEPDFRWEAFNMLNRSRFDTGVRNIDDPNLGRVLTTINDPRRMQFALKFYF